MAQENISRIASDFQSQLSGAISVGDTSFTLQSIKDTQGTDLSDGIYAFTIDRDNNNRKEYLIGQLTGATKTVSSVSSISAQGVLTANAQKIHRIGANVIISDHSILAALSRIFNGVGTINPASPLAYTTNPTLSSATQIATKGYVDSVVTGGTINSDRLILGGQTAGETIANGDIVYFKSSDQRWWLAQADDIDTLGSQFGVAQGSGTAGNPVTDGVLIYGKAENFTGLTAGSKYFLSDTPGGVSTTAGTSSVSMGMAEDTGTILFNPSSAPTAFVTTSAGAGDAGKGVKLNEVGSLDSSLTKTNKTYYTLTQRGDLTSVYNLTKSGSTVRYTWNGTGTDPNINSTNFPIGSLFNVQSMAANRTNANMGTFTVTNVGTNWVEVNNAGGSARSNDICVLYTGISHTWTKPTGLTSILVELIGGGGGAHGSYRSTSSSYTTHGGCGGGGGGYCLKKISASALGATESIYIGPGGPGGEGMQGSAGSSASDGVDGETSTFGSHCSATGGKKAVRAGFVPGDGGIGIGGDLNIQGGSGEKLDSNGPSIGRNGGMSALGFGGGGTGNIFDSAFGKNYGGGGAGNPGVISTQGPTGGFGAPGIVIITEFY